MAAPLEVLFSTGAGRRDRLAVLTGLGGITIAAWLYLVLEAPRTMRMSSGAMESMGHAGPWTATTFGLGLLMWTSMMIAMMLPTAAPMTLVYAAVARKAERQGNPVAPTSVFVAGYLAMWALFSALATAAQSWLDGLALLSPQMSARSPVLAGLLLITAGAYQLSPAKGACLKHCRAPAHFVSQHWRRGTAGAFRMGLVHGAYCLGCCWILMALLFVGGVMNLLWVAAVAAFVLLEKTFPFGELGGRVAGGAMAVVGVVLLVGVVV